MISLRQTLLLATTLLVSSACDKGEITNRRESEIKKVLCDDINTVKLISEDRKVRKKRLEVAKSIGGCELRNIALEIVLDYSYQSSNPGTFTVYHEAKEALELAQKEGVDEDGEIERAYKEALRKNAINIIAEFKAENTNTGNKTENKTTRPYKVKEVVKLAQEKGIDEDGEIERAYKEALKAYVLNSISEYYLNIVDGGYLSTEAEYALKLAQEEGIDENGEIERIYKEVVKEDALNRIAEYKEKGGARLRVSADTGLM